MEQRKQIRNFAIIAHIDHGKSTLADRLLEATGTIEKRQMTEQILDSNPIERERGITIKLAPVRMKYILPPSLQKIFNFDFCILNLIDTPGHVDFSYEVSRSLSACEGVILVVDASAGIQAQTMAHMNLAISKNLKVIPVINKIDLPTARVTETKKSLMDVFHFSQEDIMEISAKKGTNIHNLLDTIVQKIPFPKGNTDKPLKGLVFNSLYDPHKGVIIFIRIIDGTVTPKDNLQLFATKAQFHPLEVGIFTPEMVACKRLSCGEVGYIATGLKDLDFARVGDTLFSNDCVNTPLPGYKEPKPMVFLCFYPTDQDDYLLLRQSLEKLHLCDSSFNFNPHSSIALGKGFICGFLGLLHAEIIQERLSGEFGMEIIAFAPTVEYKMIKTNGETVYIHTPQDYPDPSVIREISEPYMYTTIFSPDKYVGNVIQLAQEKRARMINLEYIEHQAKFTYTIPLAEMIIDFFDRLKSVTSGYASLDYEFYDFMKTKTVKLEVLINKKQVDAFSQIVVYDNVGKIAEKLVLRLKELIPRHQFEIPIQAVVGGKILARSNVRSFRKDVTKKLYGGDQSRKDKLLDAQKKGKKRMREFGKVTIPQEIFLKVFKES